MKISLLPLGLTSTMIVGICASPFTALAQFSPIQDATQTVIINGDNNTVNQEINQTIIYRRGRRNRRTSPFSRRRLKRSNRYGRYGRRYKKDRGWRRSWKRGRSYNDDDDD